jgi:Flp pilus assembly protein TadD
MGSMQEQTEEPEGTTTAMAEDPEASPGQRAYDEGRNRFLANDVTGAIERFEEAARLMPRNPLVHKQLGRAYMRAGSVDRAADAYRRYLDLSPSAPDRAIVERIIERGGG